MSEPGHVVQPLWGRVQRLSWMLFGKVLVHRLSVPFRDVEITKSVLKEQFNLEVPDRDGFFLPWIFFFFF